MYICPLLLGKFKRIEKYLDIEMPIRLYNSFQIKTIEIEQSSRV